MWRSLFIALGIVAMILGAECLAIEKAILAPPDRAAAANAGASLAPAKEFTPPEWAPWGLLSSGAVVVLYSFTIPQRVGNK